MIQKTGIMVDTDPTFPNQTVFEQSGEQRMITAIGLEPDTTYHVKGYVVVDGERVYSNNTKQFTTAAVSYLTIKSTSAQTNWVQLNKYGTSAQNITVEYSTDGRTWTSWTAAGSASPIAAELEEGESIMFRGINNAGFFSSTSNYVYFSSTGPCEISGDVNTLINKYGGDITLPNNAFRRLFYNMNKADISSLVLPSTTLAYGCYQEMFYGCRGLTTAPVLPATTLGNYCYNSMFQFCTSLTQAPALPATTLATYCYSSMFNGCTSLTQAPALPATRLATYCYYYMFQDCTSLTQAPALPATTLVGNCYNSMFTGCTSLRTAPVLPATTLVTNCYRYMFVGCTSLNKIITYATTWSTSYAGNWVQNVAQTGIFYNLGQASNIPIDDNSGVPIGWTPKTSIDFVKIENTYNGANSIYLSGFGDYNLSIAVKYSTDLVNWTEYDFRNGNSGVSVTLQAGESVYFCGNNSTFNSRSSYVKFSSDYSCEVSGDINTLLNEFGGDMSLPTRGACFFRLFQGMNHMENAGIILPSTTLSTSCYEQMFYNCSSMTAAPNLPATTLAENCYYDMFDGCTSLTTAPNLPATTIYDGSYRYMFSGCTSLTTAPSMTVTILNYGCCYGMFLNCTSLTNISGISLQATTAAMDCYNNMFLNCTSLTTAPATLSLTTLAEQCCANMFTNCSSLTTAPALPATTLATRCYDAMFMNCTALTTAPELPATSINATECYAYMFNNCPSLNKIIVRATSWSTSNAVDWVNGVSRTGDFYNLGSATIPTNTNGIPSGWTVHTSL